MIEIHKKEDCCGCHACLQICPKKCILMQEDEEGFLYPHVDKENCINCGLCEKVCPVINQSEPHKPLKVYAAKNPNEELRMASSSGGVFTLLAERTINNGGVVFGARFNEKWEVVHDFTETIEGIAPFRGSKYVQSTIGDNYQKAEQFLKQGREVLFTGTPCQIAGLHKYLRKEYPNLLKVNVICQGVPSPLIWNRYIDYIKNTSEIISISFRDKTTGWSSYSVKYVFKDHVMKVPACRDLYMKGFMNYFFLRPSCYDCTSKNGKCYSDISIGDFWGIWNYYPKFDDKKGISLIMAYTVKGIKSITNMDMNYFDAKYVEALKGNPMIEKSVEMSSIRNRFWHIFLQQGINSISILCNELRPSLIKIYINRFIRLLFIIKFKLNHINHGKNPTCFRHSS